MTVVANIETIKPAQTSSQKGRSPRNGKNDRVQESDTAGRAVATQRDAFYLRSADIVLPGGTATAPYLAQQISQLWPTSPAAAPKTAANAYARNNLSFGEESREDSVYA